MALQSVIAITVFDPLNPKELQAWFTANPLVTVTAMAVYGNSFIVVYN